MLFLRSALLLSGMFGSLQPAFVRLFSAGEYRQAGGIQEGRVYNYRLFEPAAGEPGERFPLIVWLHGFGESGDDNVHHLRWLDQLIFKDTSKREKYPFYLLAVQCPREDPVWRHGQKDTDGGGDMIDVAHGVVQDLLSRLPVDRERIYLAGLSSGGNGCWEYAMRHPGFFAAVAPMAAGYSATEGLGRLVSIPIWVFHGSNDASVSAEGARRMTQRLRELGGNVCLTEISTTSHDCWTAAFGEYRLLDWLLMQRRGEQNIGHPPGVVPLSARVENALAGWAWWQLFLQVFVLFVVAVALARSLRSIQSARFKRMASRHSRIPS